VGPACQTPRGRHVSRRRRGLKPLSGQRAARPDNSPRPRRRRLDSASPACLPTAPHLTCAAAALTGRVRAPLSEDATPRRPSASEPPPPPGRLRRREHDHGPPPARTSKPSYLELQPGVELLGVGSGSYWRRRDPAGEDEQTAVAWSYSQASSSLAAGVGSCW
jgi:hypothetical protein